MFGMVSTLIVVPEKAHVDAIVNSLISRSALGRDAGPVEHRPKVRGAAAPFGSQRLIHAAQNIAGPDRAVHVIWPHRTTAG